MPFEYGVETIVSLPSDLSSEKSLFGRSYETSASPRSSSALLLPASGTMRQITRLIFGNGPPFQLSLRSNTTCEPAVQFVTLKAPLPTVLSLVYSSPQGSCSVACFLTSCELSTQGTMTARSGTVSRSFFAKSTRNVCSSTTTNCSGFVSDPALI